MHNPSTFLTVVLFCLALSTASPAAEREFRVLLVPKGTNTVFWSSVVSGAEAEARVQNVRLSVRSPVTDGDVPSQAEILKFALGQPYDAVILAPSEASALRSAVQQLCDAGKKVFVIDSPMDEDCVQASIATDNYLAGSTAGHYIAREMGGKGNLFLSGIKAGVTSTDARRDGFTASLQAYPEIAVKALPAHENYDIGSIRSAALEFARKLTGSNALFAVNEASTTGVYLALKHHHKAPSTLLVGFDDTPMLRQAVKDGDIKGLIVQSPELMGRLAVENASKAL